MPLPSHDIDDFEGMVKQLVGTVHRKPVRVAWLTALAAALRSIHDTFLSFTDAKIEELKYNGQTIALENFLQKKFGLGIYITNNVGAVDGCFAGSGSDVSSFFGSGLDVGSFIDLSYTVVIYDFTVNVPGSITFTMSEMEAYINKYKLFGKTYNIVIV